MEEIWKDIEGYEGLYQVSNFGNVKSLSKMWKSGSGYYIQKEIILKQQLKSKRYLGVGLTKNKKWKNFLVHRLVAEAFLENPNHYNQINHIDCNKLNNNIENLEWCSQEQNLEHAYKNGLLTKRRLSNEKYNSKK